MRRRYVQDPTTGKLHEVSQDFVQEKPQMHVGALWGDRIYDGMRASDGTPIDSRTKHRRFMKERNLTTVDDYKETWKGDAKVREEIRTDGGDHKERKRQIVEAVNQLEAQRRR